MWRRTHRTYLGIIVPGDKTVPPTRWWNHLWLLLWGWKCYAFFSVRYVPSDGYFVGFRDFTEKTMIQSVKQTSPEFRVRIGYEDCEFFAINAKGKPIDLDFKGCRKITHPSEKRRFPLI